MIIFYILFQYIGLNPKPISLQTNLLQKKVLINEYFYSNSIVESNRNVFINGENEIQDCEFILCCSSYDGGAIYTTEPLTIINCLFSSNSGSKGGCIYSKSFISCNRSTFISCYADYGAGIFSKSQISSQSIIKQVCFSNIEAKSYACFYRESSGNSTITFTNVTYCSVDDKVAAFSLYKTSLHLSYFRCLEVSGFSDLTILLDSCENNNIQQCLFWGAQTSFAEQETSLAVHFTNINSICRISNALFFPLYMKPKTYAFKATNGAKIILNQCCLSTSAEDSFFGNVQYADNTRFSTDCNDMINQKAVTFIGYYSFDIDKKKAIYFSNLQDIFILFFTFFLTFIAGLVTGFWIINSTYSILIAIQKLLMGK